LNDRAIEWDTVFCWRPISKVQKQLFGYFPEIEERIFAKSGYTAQELSQVEMAFETNTKYSKEIGTTWLYPPTEEILIEDQYNGLAAVVDVLLALDNIKPEDHYKGKFKTHPKLITHDH
jgi:hypothetical protein